MKSVRGIDWRVYAIIDAAGADPVGLCAAALAGGAGVVQLRDKRGDTRAMLALGRELLSQCRAAGAVFIVNDRVDVALALDADGVHVGPHDLPVADVRRIAPGLIVGASAGTPDEARSAVAAGASYLGSGAVFDARGSKPDAHHNRGLDALAAVVAAVDVPVVGIGGITVENSALVAQTGAAGVAVIRALSDAGDPGAAVRALSVAMTP